MDVLSSSNSVCARGLPPSALPGISPLRGKIRCRAHSFYWQGIILLPISPLEGEMPGRAEGGNPTIEGAGR
ncbi:propionyl-coenzyme A carboxylase alpha polypeptide [Agrobacterium tumefaciens]|uniref:Propionyl-coenzyme A carboxylase alpha polypeptide n=1 Tax=Agrobacterium tumefaciens TaxID=358 RepID=A0AAE6EH31_AGRTU|nr:propionyl-coenzyme A carboxylase alpha polypeptide [Agrobacterium tumefaciens]QCL81392.1 propionyl-coenzyme A carboxylase alpha polypeptide [Agrobacterium tumefaciens]